MMTATWNNGYRAGVRGLTAASDDATYLEGHNAGRIRRSRNGKYTSNTASQVKAAEDSMQAKWGVKRFAKAVRCPSCGTNNQLRVPASSVCLGCRVKGVAA